MFYKEQVITFKDLYLKRKSDLEKFEKDYEGNIFYVQNGNINLADSMAAAIVENRDVKVLCSKDCKGLCPSCGTNLNKAECNCKDENIDPRLEAFKNLKF